MFDIQFTLALQTFELVLSHIQLNNLTKFAKFIIELTRLLVGFVIFSCHETDFIEVALGEALDEVYQEGEVTLSVEWELVITSLIEVVHANLQIGSVNNQHMIKFFML